MTEMQELTLPCTLTADAFFIARKCGQNIKTTSLNLLTTAKRVYD